jgi:hypothetical protein
MAVLPDRGEGDVGVTITSNGNLKSVGPLTYLCSLVLKGQCNEIFCFFS